MSPYMQNSDAPQQRVAIGPQPVDQTQAPSEPWTYNDDISLQQVNQGIAAAQKQLDSGELSPEDHARHMSFLKPKQMKLMASKKQFTQQQQEEQKQQAMHGAALQEAIRAVHGSTRAAAFPQTVAEFTDPATGETEHFVQDDKGNFKPIKFEAHRSRDELRAQAEASLGGADNSSVPPEVLEPMENSQGAPNRTSSQRMVYNEGNGPAYGVPEANRVDPWLRQPGKGIAGAVAGGGAVEPAPEKLAMSPSEEHDFHASESPPIPLEEFVAQQTGAPPQQQAGTPPQRAPAPSIRDFPNTPRVLNEFGEDITGQRPGQSTRGARDAFGRPTGEDNAHLEAEFLRRAEQALARSKPQLTGNRTHDAYLLQNWQSHVHSLGSQMLTDYNRHKEHESQQSALSVERQRAEKVRIEEKQREEKAASEESQRKEQERRDRHAAEAKSEENTRWTHYEQEVNKERHERQTLEYKAGLEGQTDKLPPKQAYLENNAKMSEEIKARTLNSYAREGREPPSAARFKAMGGNSPPPTGKKVEGELPPLGDQANLDAYPPITKSGGGMGNISERTPEEQLHPDQKKQMGLFADTNKRLGAEENLPVHAKVKLQQALFEAKGLYEKYGHPGKMPAEAKDRYQKNIVLVDSVLKGGEARRTFLKSFPRDPNWLKEFETEPETGPGGDGVNMTLPQ